MLKNVTIVVMAAALLSVCGFEGVRYYKGRNAIPEQKAETSRENDTKLAPIVDPKKKAETSWVVDTKHDPIRGTSETVIHRTADGELGDDIYSPAEISLHCPTGKRPYAVIYTGRLFGYRRGVVHFEWRFDNREPQQGEWNVDDDFRTVWPWNGFLESAVQAKSLWLRVRTAENGYSNLHFDLTGINDLFRNKCPAAAVPQSAGERGDNATSEGHSGSNMVPAGGRWKFLSDNGQSLWMLLVDQPETSGVTIKCSAQRTIVFLRFHSQAESTDGETVMLGISINGGRPFAQEMKISNGYLYPDEQTALSILRADSVLIEYMAANGKHSLTFHPKGLNWRDVKSGCVWPTLASGVR